MNTLLTTGPTYRRTKRGENSRKFVVDRLNKEEKLFVALNFLELR